MPSRAAAKLNQALLATPNLSAESKAILETGVSPLTATQEMIDIWTDAYAAHIKKAGLKQDLQQHLLDALEKARSSLKHNAPSVNLWRSPGPMDVAIDGDPNLTLGKQLDRHLSRKSFQNCVKHTAHLFVVSNVINAGGAVIMHWKDYAPEHASIIETLFSPKFYRRILNDERFMQNVTWNAIFMTGYGALACLRNQTLGYWGLVAFATASAIIGQIPTGISVRQTLTNVGYISTVSYWKGRLSLWAVEKYQSEKLPFPKTVETLIWMINEGAGALIYPAWDDVTRHYCNDPAPPTSNSP